MEPTENKEKKNFLGKVWGVVWRLALLFLILMGLLYTVRRVSYRVRNRQSTPIYHTWDAPIAYWHKDDDEVYLYNMETKKTISSKWYWISDVPEGDDSLAVFCKKMGRHGKKRLRGYFNSHTGEVMIKPRYERAWVFSEGVGAVSENSVKVGFIDSDGHYVIPPVFPYVDYIDYYFRDGYCMVPKATTSSNDTIKYGAIDHSGNWVLPPLYEYVRHDDSDVYIVKKNGKFGMLDHHMKWLFEPEYDYLSTYSTEERTVLIAKGSIQQLVTFDGEVLEPFVIDGMSTLEYETDDDYKMSNYLRFSVAGKQGVMDSRDGRIIIPAIFEVVKMASADMFICDIDDEDCESESVLYDLEGHPLGDELLKETKKLIETD